MVLGVTLLVTRADRRLNEAPHAEVVNIIRQTFSDNIGHTTSQQQLPLGLEVYRRYG